MADAYPYTISNNKLEPFFTRIRTAARPERLSQELVATWGFTASNDRAIPRVLRLLGFLNENNGPTPFYDRLRDGNDWRHVLAERLRETYSDLYALDPSIHKAGDAEVKGAMARITGKDEESVKRYLATFKTLAGLAKFDGPAAPEPTLPPAPAPSVSPKTAIPDHAMPQQLRKTEYHYNIQIHLPVTTDITVYNAIFKSLRDNLGV